MSTIQEYAGFFARQIIGRTVIRDHLWAALRADLASVVGFTVGEAIFDVTATGLSISTTDNDDALGDRRLSVVGRLPGTTANGDVFTAIGNGGGTVDVVSGDRTYTIHDPAWFSNLPYENESGVTYNVYVGATWFPTDVGSGRNGGLGYATKVDAPGFTVNPNSVSDAGDHLEFAIGSNLTDLGMQPWNTSNTNDPDWSYDCVVWLDTDQPGVEIADSDPDVAIARAKLVKDPASGNWLVSLSGIGDGYLGQTNPSSEANHYKIAVLGPLITTTDLDGDSAWLRIGAVTSGVTETVSTTGQKIVYDLATIINNYVTMLGAFAVEHDDVTGAHTDVNADSISVSGSASVSGATTLSSLDVTNGTTTDTLVAATSVLVAALTSISANGVTSPRLIAIGSDITGDFGHKYDNPQVFVIPMSPYMGGWTPGNPGSEDNPVRVSDTPSYVHASGTDGIWLIKPIPMHHNGMVSATNITLTSISYRYWRETANDVVTVRVMRQRINGTTAPEVLATEDGPVIGASWNESTVTINAAVDTGYEYWVEINVRPDSPLATAAARISNVWVDVTKVAVE